MLTLSSAFDQLDRTLKENNESNDFSSDVNWRQSAWRAKLLKIIHNLDIQGVTGRVCFSNGDRVGEIVIEQILGKQET